jgi:hypothetical protein
MKKDKEREEEKKDIKKLKPEDRTWSGLES